MKEANLPNDSRKTEPPSIDSDLNLNNSELNNPAEIEKETTDTPTAQALTDTPADTPAPDDKAQGESAAAQATTAESAPIEGAPEAVAEAPKRTKRKRSKLYMVWYTVVKRCFDFLSSLIVSILLTPLYLIVTIVMLFKSFGSPLYKQVRLGKNGKILKIYKFRSMRKGADNLEKFLTPEQLEEYKREYKLKDDPRLIGYKRAGDGEKERCFGAKIRKTSIDELPQILFNICILGNMSVVGPRPILKEELEKNYTPDEQKILLSSKPGLTGYWQAYARNNATYASGERQKMELYYAEHKSLWLDIKILFRTVISVLKKDGAE